MFILTKDDGFGKELIGTYPTKEKAFEARIEAVREFLYNLRDNEEIDKYAVEDWMWGVKDTKEMNYYVDEGCGCSFDIVEA